ncbi:MAG: HAMP domain-containing protein [Acidobacteriia bacterium]|nr:HAMP domain-containing protein [Terriglobia bacterium]
MKKRLLYGFAIVLLVVSVLLVVWQGSFRIGFGPRDPSQTFAFWAISTLIFILMVTLGFILFRTGLKLYIERQANREGSRLRSKLVWGALLLSFVPVLFLVLFSYFVLNRSLAAWFSSPAENQVKLFVSVAAQLEHEMQDEVDAQTALLAAQPETRQLLSGGGRTPGLLERFSRQYGFRSAGIFQPGATRPLDSWGPRINPAPNGRLIISSAPVIEAGRTIGSVSVASELPIDIARQIHAIEDLSRQSNQIRENRKQVRTFYVMLMALITLFVLYIAVWLALFFAKQISVPISALLEAAGEIRGGNLRYRISARGIDELGSLVRGFNQMTQELEAKSAELDRRRRFTEAILESIPTGVLSIGSDGSIQHTNQALAKIFPPDQAARAARLEDLFSREDTAEIKYMMKRARRTGVASRQLELRLGNRNLQLAVTVSALEEKLNSGFVVVLEDTTELLRAQKAAAWREVARRVAHEIKNPLTPIALSAERIERQIDRAGVADGTSRIIHECVATISKSVKSVQSLVDEFSVFARFPTAQPVRCELNRLVAGALAVFEGRLTGIRIHTTFASGLPPVNLDPDQFQRVVVNLVDNAAEAMQQSLVKELFIATQQGTAETVELVVADSGPGVSPEDKEKLFLPYFSTKKRGTGLGLAIVSQIVAEHGAQIRVEDNVPSGARFTIEIPALVDSEPAAAPAIAGPARTDGVLQA